MRPDSAKAELAGVEVLANECYVESMTKRFEEAVTEIRKLPGEVQDRVADLMMELAGRDDPHPALTAEQVEGVYHALEQARRREFASDESVERLLYRPWK
jgi:hypothetical protein